LVAEKSSSSNMFHLVSLVVQFIESVAVVVIVGMVCAWEVLHMARQLFPPNKEL
jgi:hypothetical protein